MALQPADIPKTKAAKRASRVGKNPKTGAELKIADHRAEVHRRRNVQGGCREEEVMTTIADRRIAVGVTRRDLSGNPLLRVP